MLDKIKELLGEELSKQVIEKLGTVELAIMNNGSVVPAEKYDILKAEYKGLNSKYDTDINDFNEKLETATNNSADYETLKGTLETFKADNQKMTDEYQAEKTKIKKNSAIDLALIRANVDEEYFEMVKSQVNMDNLTFENDNLIGLSDSIAALQGKFPKLFGEMKKVGATPPGNDINPPVGKKQQLIKQYNEAEAKGQGRLMMSISNQIKQLE